MRYIYSNKDHLGNVRLSFTKDLKVMDKNDYYPFGMSFLKTSVSLYDPMAIPYNYKYNGKELQETGFYDYGARMYMPDVGRWTQIDPLAETSRRFSPYLYANNNPLRFIDPDGMDEQEAEQEMDKQDDERHSQETIEGKSIADTDSMSPNGVNSDAMHQSAMDALDDGGPRKPIRSTSIKSFDQNHSLSASEGSKAIHVPEMPNNRVGEGSGMIVPSGSQSIVTGDMIFYDDKTANLNLIVEGARMNTAGDYMANYDITDSDGKTINKGILRGYGINRQDFKVVADPDSHNTIISTFYLKNVPINSTININIGLINQIPMGSDDAIRTHHTIRVK